MVRVSMVRAYNEGHARAEIGTFNVDAKYLVPVLFRRLFNGTKHEGRGVVHQYINPPELRNYVRNTRFYLLLYRYVYFTIDWL